MSTNPLVNPIVLSFPTATTAITLNKPQHITSLATSGILMGVIMRRWSASKQNREVSNEVAQKKRAASTAGRYVQNLLADHPKHRALMNHRATVYSWLNRLGFPYCQTKLYYVPTARIAQARKEFEQLKAQDEQMLEDFLTHYPSIVSDAAFKQGEMFDRSLYPNVERVRARFTMELFTSEIPQSDFAVQLANDLADDLHKNYSRQTEQLVQRILSAQSEQLIDVMESLSHCCDTETTVDDAGKIKIRRRRIYDSTIAKALELCDTFKDFNLTSDPHLERARAALQSVLTTVPNTETLRDSDTLRAVVKMEVDDILSKFRPAAPILDDSDDE